MQNTKTFSLEIEKMAQEKSITHMDAVLEYCKTKELEPESVTRLISKSLVFSKPWMGCYCREFFRGFINGNHLNLKK